MQLNSRRSEQRSHNSTSALNFRNNSSNFSSLSITCHITLESCSYALKQLYLLHYTFIHTVCMLQYAYIHTAYQYIRIIFDVYVVSQLLNHNIKYYGKAIFCLLCFQQPFLNAFRVDQKFSCMCALCVYECVILMDIIFIQDFVGCNDLCK